MRIHTRPDTPDGPPRRERVLGASRLAADLVGTRTHFR